MTEAVTTTTAPAAEAPPTVFSTPREAVAELERRESERRAQRKAEKAEKAEDRAAAQARAAKMEAELDAEHDGEDEDPRRVKQDEPKAKDKERRDAKADEADDEADDEVEARDDAGDDDDAGEREEATDDGDDEQEKATTVEIDGKTLEIPKGTPKAVVDAVSKLAGDLKSDYSRKTQAAAEATKAAAERSQAAEALLGQVQRAQQSVVQFAQQMIGQPPPLQLAQTDIQAYTIQKALYDQRVQQLQAVTGQGRELDGVSKQRQEAASKQALAEEAQKMVRVLPELADANKRAAFHKRAVEAAAASGFSAEDVSGVADHRMLHLLHRLVTAEGKLAAYAAAGTSVKQKLANVPPKTLKAGNSVSTEQAKSEKGGRAKAEFLRSGRTLKDVRRYLAATD